jgi:hypothetical protein
MSSANAMTEQTVWKEKEAGVSRLLKLRTMVVDMKGRTRMDGYEEGDSLCA